MEEILVTSTLSQLHFQFQDEDFVQKPEPNSSIISLEKWIAIGVLTILSALFGLIPYRMFRTNKLTETGIDPSGSNLSKLVLSTLSSISGGILLSTTIVHILPEVREKSEGVPDLIAFFGDGYPVAEILMLGGFCLIYLFEEVVHLIVGRGQEHFHPGHDGHEKSMGHKECTSLVGNKIEEEEGQMSSEKEDSVGVRGSMTPDKRPLSSLRAFLSLFALSFHAVMEGIAIGLQGSSDLWLIFGAIASHKFLIAFCLGMELVKSGVKFGSFLASILIFSAVSPLGILIGSALSAETSLVQNEILVVIEGLACGTLLYVVFFEILTWNRDDSNKHGLMGLMQFLGTFVGILFSTYLFSQPHSHDNHDRHPHIDPILGAT